jgi:uncharacterized OB-fold protein
MDLNNKVYVPENPGDYPEDFEMENGLYMNQCRECGNMFCGHKRRGICKVCAEEVESETESYVEKFKGWDEEKQNAFIKEMKELCEMLKQKLEEF